MAILGQRDFKAGWIPDSNAVNGRPDGFLRMDNCCLDDEGAVTIVRGMDKVSGDLLAVPQEVFSRVFNGQKHRYVGLDNATVLKDVNEAETYATSVLTGGSTGGLHSFGVSLGKVLICSGTQKKKDNGTTISNLGVEVPAAAPTSIGKAKTILDIAGAHASYSLEEGTSLSNPTGSSVQLTTSTTTGRGQVKLIESIDATNFGGSGNDDLRDDFEIDVRFADSGNIIGFAIQFFLASGSGDATGENSDYFFKEFKSQDTINHFSAGIDVWSKLRCQRKDFTRVGRTDTLGWADIETIIITFVTTEDDVVRFAAVDFFGGQGELEGEYDYYQINIFDDGKNISKSIASTLSSSTLVNNQTITVTPNAPSGFPTNPNEIWIYRRKKGINGTDTWYRIATLTATTAFDDNKSDLDAVRDNIKINLHLAAIPNNVRAIVGMYHGRTLYLTSDKLYASDNFNPDAIDTRLTLDFSGDETERNLFIVKVDLAVLIVGTTVDLYEIGGTFSLFDDNSTDINQRELGVGNPPISRAAAVYNHQVIYMANDGWRINSGAIIQTIVGNTRSMYKVDPRHGQAAVLVKGQDTVRYRCAVSKDKLWAIVTEVGGTNRRIYVYDFKLQYWYPIFLAPVCIFVEEDGTIICGFAEGGAGDFIRTMDNGIGIDHGGGTGTGFGVTLRTAFIDNGEPNRRKDCYTLKIFADSDNTSLNINLATEGGSTSLLKAQAFNGLELITIKLNGTAFDLKKSFQIEFIGTLTTFKLLYWTIDYDPRPEQLNHLRVPPTNFGKAGLKIWNDLPFSLDTLGNVVTVTPVLDRISLPTVASNFTGKGLQTLTFDQEREGFEVGLDLQSALDTVFEFYEMVPPSILELIPDKTLWLRIPTTDWGIPAKKRLRTIPIVINTRGQNVTFTPRIDGVNATASTLNSTEKRTLFHYFTTDIFGIDFSAILSADTTTPFEFYGLPRPEEVEVLPVGKRLDQIGPLDFDKLAKLREILIRMVAGSVDVSYDLKAQDISIKTGTITTVANIDDIYRISLPKFPNKLRVVRLELSDTVPIHRYWAKFRYAIGGNETSLKTVMVGDRK